MNCKQTKRDTDITFASNHSIILHLKHRAKAHMNEDIKSGTRTCILHRNVVHIKQLRIFRLMRSMYLVWQATVNL